jgi:predicted MFS family arabinose efflux permease
LNALAPWLPVNKFASPALLALCLILIETLYLYIYLPETHSKKTEKVQPKSSQITVFAKLHFAFLFLFSGMEFTLTFLTFDRFGFSNKEQGYLLAFIGVLSALIQGGYVRRKNAPAKIAIQGIMSCSVGLFIVSMAHTKIVLYVGAAFLAFTSGTVVTSLTTLASQTDGKSRGEVLGNFRSLGQLGRSLGPLVASTVYWIYGSHIAYATAALSLAALVIYAKPKMPKVKRE